MNKKLDDNIMDTLLQAQSNEITEFHIYKRLASRIKDRNNSRILSEIAEDEKRHYNFWKKYTAQERKPVKLKVFFYYWLAIIFGITFSIKLMEKGEERAQINYTELLSSIPEAEQIIEEEDSHEEKLIAMLQEEHLQYVGSVVLGLNDALVELTGTLAGLTFALKDTRIIAMVGLITGIAASLSMGASEYLSTRSDSPEDNALKSALYTGVAYVITVFLLILPYLLLNSYLFALIFTVVIAILIILVFNFYVSVARDLDFKKRFTEMAAISLGVALFSFGIGILVRVFLGVDV